MALDENRQNRGIPFAEVILDTTGRHVLPVDQKAEPISAWSFHRRL